MELHVHIHEEEGSYWAEVVELPGCFASGDNLDELKEALLEAIDLYLEERTPGRPNGGAVRVSEMTLVCA